MPQFFIYNLAHLRVFMHRENCFHAGMRTQYFAQGFINMAHRFAKVFAAVRGH